MKYNLQNKFIKEWPYEDDFVSHAYSQTMYGGEPSDNSIECACYWRKKYNKVIEYIEKLTGVLINSEEKQKGAPFDEEKTMM